MSPATSENPDQAKGSHSRHNISRSDEVSKLKAKYALQQVLNNPLKHLTGINLYLRLAKQYEEHHSFGSAIDAHWKVIENAEARIEEILEHAKDGKIGDISSRELIENTHDYIHHSIAAITELELKKTDTANRPISAIIAGVQKPVLKTVHKISKTRATAAIQEGVINFALHSTYIVHNNEENTQFIFNEDNFNLIEREKLLRSLVGISQNLIKELRVDAHRDPEIAKFCAAQRRLNADYYKQLRDEANYFEEMASSLLYGTYTATTLDEFERSYRILEDFLTQWEGKKNVPRKEPFYKRAYASIYALKFLGTSNLKDRIVQLKLINYYLNQTSSRAKQTYKLYENYYVLLSRIQNASSFESVKLPEQKRFTFPDTVRSDVQETKTNYRDLIKLVQFASDGKVKSPISSIGLSSVFNLLESQIVSQNMALGLTKKAISHLLGEEIVPMDILDENQDEKLVQDLLKQGEGTSTEVKKSFSDTDSLGEVISAFANTKGGKVIIGFEEIDENSEYIGENIIGHDFILLGLPSTPTIDNQKKRFALAMHDAGIPVEDLVIDTALMVKGKRVCIIEVPNLSGVKPVFYKKNLYIRVGAQNQRLKTEDVVRRLQGVIIE